MNFYLKLLIKILERSMTAKDSEILKKLKSGYDLSSEEKKELICMTGKKLLLHMVNKNILMQM